MTKLCFLTPPSPWYKQETVQSGKLYNTSSIDAQEISSPFDYDGKMILWFEHDGDPREFPLSAIYDGTILEFIPSGWIPLINEKKIHVVISTWQESWAPVRSTNDHYEYLDLHKILTDSADKLGIEKKQITWLCGDLRAEKFVGNQSGINIKSRCVFFHSYAKMILAEYGDKENYKNDYTYEKNNFCLFLNRSIKTHRCYMLARVWHYMQNNKLRFHPKFSMPRTLHGHTICDAHSELKYIVDNKNYDKKNLIDHAALAKSVLELYYYSPFEIDVKHEENNCAEIDSIKSIDDEYKSSMISLITEAVIDGDKLFITDATIYSIMRCIPALIVGNYGTLQQLKDWGFKTFEDILDESYDSITNEIERMETVLHSLVKFDQLCQTNNWNDITDKIKPVLDHNYYHFFELAKKHEKELQAWLYSL